MKAQTYTFSITITTGTKEQQEVLEQALENALEQMAESSDPDLDIITTSVSSTGDWDHDIPTD